MKNKHEGLATGIKGKLRQDMVVKHRIHKLVEYLGRLIDGDQKVTPNLVHERAIKLKESRGKAKESRW